MAITPVAVRSTVLGEGRPALIVPLTAPSEPALLAEAEAVAGHGADLVEWRIDRFAPELDDDAHRGAVLRTLAAVRTRLDADGPGPGLLVTFRTRAEGGGRAIGAADLAALLGDVIGQGGADLLDLEADALGEHMVAVVARARAAGIATIASHHELRHTPSEPEMVATLRRLQDTGADVVKLAVMPQGPSDVLDLLRATRIMGDEHARVPVVTMSMGALGAVSRIAGEEFGSAATFGTIGRASAPGQLPAEIVLAAQALLRG